MLNKLIIMKCGHPADCIMDDVPYHSEKWSVAACSACFNDFSTALQPACIVNDKQPEKTRSKVELNYNTTLICGIVVLIIFFTIIIVSI